MNLLEGPTGAVRPTMAAILVLQDPCLYSSISSSLSSLLSQFLEMVLQQVLYDLVLNMSSRLGRQTCRCTLFQSSKVSVMTASFLLLLLLLRSS